MWNDTRALTVLRISYRQNTSELEETVGILSGRLEAQDKELLVFKDQLKVAQDQLKLALGAHQEEILSFKEKLQVAKQEARGEGEVEILKSQLSTENGITNDWKTDVWEYPAGEEAGGGEVGKRGGGAEEGAGGE